jgi:hypothetical protein
MSATPICLCADGTDKYPNIRMDQLTVIAAAAAVFSVSSS